MVFELERVHPDPWSLSPHQVVMRIAALRDRERQEMLRAASAASVPHMKKADHKKWWQQHG